MFAAAFQGPVNDLPVNPIKVLQPVVVRRYQIKQVTTGVIAVADMPPVIYCPSQYNIAELTVLYRAKSGRSETVCQYSGIQYG